jgi:putative ABC transport system permease protein
MIKSYFVVALRNFWRHKTFSGINILGLAIGISASLVIFLLVHYDLSFDKFEPQPHRIFRVVWKNWEPGNDEPQYTSAVPLPMGPAIENEITGIDLVAPFSTWYNAKVTIPYPNTGQPRSLDEQKDCAFADARYTNLLGYTWLYGSPATALRQPYQVVLTEKNARLYFPRMAYADILGKTISFNDTVQVNVTGILKDLPGNSDFYFGTLVSRATLATSRMKPYNWDNWSMTFSNDQLFVRLAPGTTAATLAPRLTDLNKRHSPGQMPPGFRSEIALEPLGDLHFDTRYHGFDQGRMAHKPTLYGLMAVAAILLLLACINFINLTTAQAAQRAKEIGIRKTMGGQRGQITIQFLNETFLLTVIATGLSICIAPMLLRLFADFIPDDFQYNLLTPAVIGFLAALVATVTLLSGFYPALVMSGFRPISVLKNQLTATTATTRSAWFRRSLTVSQFVIAQVFIIAVILVGRQINYALTMDMGFRKDAVLYFRTHWNRPAIKKNTLVAQLKTIPGIEMISVTSDPPTGSGGQGGLFYYNNGKKDIQINAQTKGGDSNYFSLYKLHLLAGVFPPQSDTTRDIVINQTLAHLMGIQHPKEALGRKLSGPHGENGPTIVGVMADFHARSIHEPINPLFVSNDTTGNTINVALKPSMGNAAAWPTTIARIEKAYRTVYPDDIFTYSFVDDTIAQFYTTEKNTARLLAWAAGLAIIISCLGLLGLVIFITNQRTKEIGIRKVIGASVTQLVTLLSKDFLKLIGLAIGIAIPIAWWGSHKWLENFAYHTDLSWWVFASGGILLLGIALVVLSIRTFKAASANPVESLRSE